jgi:hypothetical protein
VTESPLSRLVRALLLAAAAAVLLGLVVVAAAGYKVGDSGSSEATPYAVDTVVTVLLALYAVGAVALIAGTVWAGLELRRNPMPATLRRRTTFPTVLATLGLLALLLVAAQRFHWRGNFPHLRPPPSATTLSQTLSTGAGAHTKKPNRPQRSPQFRLAPFLLVLGAAGAGFGALYVAERRRSRRLPREAASVTDELVEALDETLEDLRAERDPRRAVIAAYARMERILAAHGIPRRRFEAPNEYLARVLGELSAGRAAEQLTALFERARFSTHTIDRSMKDEAIDAVEALQAELAAADAERAA